jgi:hypothetical protein
MVYPYQTDAEHIWATSNSGGHVNMHRSAMLRLKN